MPAVRIAKGIERGRPVTIVVDGQPVAAHEGETLAAALAAACRTVLRHSPRAGTARGAFCLMGLCQDCVVRVDGVPVEACRTTLRAGLVAERLR